ncbi:MAG: hypothetical protein CL920_39500 [Deltaproteobacteria bacterium]|mgnify:CR=1 FL=1|nr:hypothetical protein [Deltaproteobacteria bacterium]MBU54821.1 hypothetical protein [Deltaproteobacteria bacterium]|tara:strand:- start:19744 stop:22200 length:2457 start_codon:yes stop_codon:yes gene_type:complete
MSSRWIPEKIYNVLKFRLIRKKANDILLQFLRQEEVKTDLCTLIEESAQFPSALVAKARIRQWLREHPFWQEVYAPTEAAPGEEVWRVLRPLLEETAPFKDSATPPVKDSPLPSHPLTSMPSKKLSPPTPTPKKRITESPYTHTPSHSFGQLSPDVPPTSEMSEQWLESTRLVMLGLLSTSLLSHSVDTDHFDGFLRKKLPLYIRHGELTLTPIREVLLQTPQIEANIADAFLLKLSQQYLPWSLNLPPSLDHHPTPSHTKLYFGHHWGRWNEVPFPEKIEFTMLIMLGLLSTSVLSRWTDIKKYAIFLRKRLPSSIRDQTIHLEELSQPLLEATNAPLDVYMDYMLAVHAQPLPWSSTLPQHFFPSSNPPQEVDEAQSQSGEVFLSSKSEARHNDYFSAMEQWLDEVSSDDISPSSRATTRPPFEALSPTHISVSTSPDALAQPARALKTKSGHTPTHSPAPVSVQDLLEPPPTKTVEMDAYPEDNTKLPPTASEELDIAFASIVESDSEDELLFEAPSYTNTSETKRLAEQEDIRTPANQQQLGLIAPLSATGPLFEGEWELEESASVHDMPGRSRLATTLTDLQVEMLGELEKESVSSSSELLMAYMHENIPLGLDILEDIEEAPPSHHTPKHIHIQEETAFSFEEESETQRGQEPHQEILHDMHKRDVEGLPETGFVYSASPVQGPRNVWSESMSSAKKPKPALSSRPRLRIAGLLLVLLLALVLWLRASTPSLGTKLSPNPYDKLIPYAQVYRKAQTLSFVVEDEWRGPNLLALQGKIIKRTKQLKRMKELHYIQILNRRGKILLYIDLRAGS